MGHEALRVALGLCAMDAEEPADMLEGFGVGWSDMEGLFAFLVEGRDPDFDTAMAMLLTGFQLGIHYERVRRDLDAG